MVAARATKKNRKASGQPKSSTARFGISGLSNVTTSIV
jgi:hypothetical protein